MYKTCIRNLVNSRHLLKFGAVQVAPDRNLTIRSKIKFKILKEEDPDDNFNTWQHKFREDFRKKAEAKGLTKFDETVYNESFKLAITEEDTENIRDKKLLVLKSAIQLYNERQPRLKQDHPQFINWCVLRMFEFDLADDVELYELLFECYPTHMYQSPSIIASYFPKPTPGLYSAVDLITIGQQRSVKPTMRLYRNVAVAFGANHQITKMTRRWAWHHYVFRHSHPYPLPDGSYSFNELAFRHVEMVEYVADRTMDQRCKFKPISDQLGEYVGHSVLSSTQEDLSLLQTPGDNMRLTGPHSIWLGRVQRWYWVLRREERGHEFEGAPLGIFVSPFKEMSKEGAQIWLEDCRQNYRGIAGSNIIFDVPDEVLYIDPEEHFKERVSLFSDGIDDVFIDESILPDVIDEKKKQAIKKVGKSKEIKFIRDKDAQKKDDEW